MPDWSFFTLPEYLNSNSRSIQFLLSNSEALKTKENCRITILFCVWTGGFYGFAKGLLNLRYEDVCRAGVGTLLEIAGRP